MGIHRGGYTGGGQVYQRVGIPGIPLSTPLLLASSGGH